MILLLDDTRNLEDIKWIEYPDDGVSTVRSYDEFVKYIEGEGLPDLISYDHDLGANLLIKQEILDENGELQVYTTEIICKSGLDCAKWLVAHCDRYGLDIPAYVVHSMNPIGKANIISYLESHKRSIKQINSLL